MFGYFRDGAPMWPVLLEITYEELGLHALYKMNYVSEDVGVHKDAERRDLHTERRDTPGLSGV